MGGKTLSLSVIRVRVIKYLSHPNFFLVVLFLFKIPNICPDTGDSHSLDIFLFCTRVLGYICLIFKPSWAPIPIAPAY